VNPIKPFQDLQVSLSKIFLSEEKQCSKRRLCNLDNDVDSQCGTEDDDMCTRATGMEESKLDSCLDDVDDDLL
jgi:hypothetical protein